MKVTYVKIDKDLFWQIMAILRGLQIAQMESKGITWRTTLDDTIDKLREIAPVEK